MIVCYPSKDVPYIWDKVKPFVQEALNRGSTWTLEGVYDALTRKHAQLWTWQDPDIRAVMVTTLQDDYCLVLTIAGKDMKTWMPHLDVLEDWARSKNCKALRLHGRKGWARFGFNTIGKDANLHIMERKL